MPPCPLQDGGSWSLLLQSVKVPRLANDHRAPCLGFSICKPGTIRMAVCLPRRAVAHNSFITVMSVKGPASWTSHDVGAELYPPERDLQVPTPEPVMGPYLERSLQRQSS